MSAIGRWFSFGGRTGRRGYWRAQLVGGVVLAVIWCGGLILVDETGVGGFGAIALAALPIALLFQLATLFRRAHDRNKSAWWLLAVYLGPLVLAFVIGSQEAKTHVPAGALAALSLADLALLIWGWVELALLRGTPGPNRFGEAPAAG